MRLWLRGVKIVIFAEIPRPRRQNRKKFSTFGANYSTGMTTRIMHATKGARKRVSTPDRNEMDTTENTYL